MPTSREKRLPDDARVSPSDLWLFMVSQFRYSFGRASYITSSTAELYHRYKHSLSRPQREQLARETEEALRLAEADGRTLGYDCDHRIWKRLAEEIRTELKDES